MRRLILTSVLGLLLFTACTNDIETDAQLPEEVVLQSPVTRSADSGLLLAEVEAVADSPEEFAKHVTPDYLTSIFELLLPDMPDIFPPLFKLMVDKRLPQLDALFQKQVGGNCLNRRWKVESHVFHYKSKTPNGEDIILSGRVTFPNNTVEGVGHQVKTLTLHSHQYLLDPSWAPSRTYSFMTLRALQNSAVIEPDFQGFGIAEQYEYPSMSSKVLARQLSDCAMAALDVMRHRGVTLAPDGYSTSWGISFAAAVPLSFAKYYETEAPLNVRNAIRLASSFSAEGPTDIIALLRYYDQHPDEFMDLSLLMSAPISNVPEAELGGYSADDFFSDYLLDTKVNLGGFELTLLQAVRVGLVGIMNILDYLAAPTLSDIFAADMLTPDGHFDETSPKTKVLFTVLEKQTDLYGWSPRLPLYMACCPQDDVVPYDHIKYTYNQLSSNGLNPRVHWASVPIDGQNSPIGIMGTHLLSSLIMMFEMGCAEDPADMYRFYR